MVDAHNVIAAEGHADTVHPPAVAVGFHGVPIVEGIAPELAVFGEIIRRDACYFLGGEGFGVDEEEGEVAPQVAAVPCHVDGHIANDGHALFLGKGFDFLPLGEKYKLDELPKSGFLCKLLPVGGGIGVLGILAPFPPGPLPVGAFEGLVEGKVRQPFLGCGKGFYGLALRISQAGKGQAQGFQAAGAGKLIVGSVGGAGIKAGPGLLLGEQALFYQAAGVDIEPVTRKGAAAGVGGVHRVYRLEGEHLPIGEAHFGNALQKILGLFAKHADAIGAGKGRDIEEHAGSAFEFHG